MPVKHGLLLAFVLAACGEQQIVIVLEGDLQASSYEVILTEAHVLLKRNQRSNRVRPAPESETAFYVVQENRVAVELDEPTPLAGLELQLVGADGALPIVQAFDQQGVLIGMGILDPQRVFRDDGDNDENFPNRLEALAEITHYPIVVEPVRQPIGGIMKPPPVLEGEVMTVSCAQRPSGQAWRPRSNPDYETGQLRIVLPLDGVDAGPRVEVEGLDLDCDQHTPNLRGVNLGDEADCDDTASIVFGGNSAPPEACDAIDTDCDASTIGAALTSLPVPLPAACAACLGNQLTCFEGGDAIDGAGCAQAETCLSCALVTSPAAVGEVIGCDNSGEIGLPFSCRDGCVVRLVGVDPRWVVAIGDIDDPRAGLFQGHTVVGNKIGIVLKPIGSQIFVPNEVIGVALTMQPAAADFIQLIEVKLALDPVHQTADCRLIEQMPPCQPNG